MPDIFNFAGSGTLVVLLGIVILVLLVAYLGSRYKVAAANEALIVSGRRVSGVDGEQRLKVVRGQGTIVLPLLHRVGRLKLTARQINVNLSDAVTQQGIKVAVQGVATFKIGADDESIQNAAERFLDAKDEDVDSIVKNVLEGSLRSIVGTLTVEELNLDRQKFQQAVQSAAKGDLATSGLQIDSFTIQSIADESGYMELIGQKNQALVARDARMAKATADQEAAVREAEAEQIKINAQRDVALRRAETAMQTAAAEARADQAGPLAQAEGTQEVVRKQTELAELEAARKQKELLTSTIRPAEAEAEAQIRRAEGEKGARIAAAQADAERVKLAGQAEAAITITKGEAQARVTEVNAEAIAKQVTLEGNAEAGIVFTKGEAEAKALALRAEAYRQFNEAAVIQTVLSMLPEIVRAAAEPMSNIGTLTILSSDGASEVVRTTTRTVAEAGAAVKGLTGIDIPDLLGRAMGGGGAGGTGGRGPNGGDGGSGAGASRLGGPGGSGPGGSGAGGSGPGGSGAGGSGAGGSGAGGSGASGSPGGGSGASASGTTAARAGGSGASSGGRQPSADGGDGHDRAEALRSESDAAMARVSEAMTSAGASITSNLERAASTLATTSTAARTVTGAAPAGRSASRSETAAAASARQLALRLRDSRGIEPYLDTKLSDLERQAPRSIGQAWRAARDVVEERYGEMTVGELLARFGR